MFNYKVVVNYSNSNCGSDDYECYRLESSGWEEIIRFCYNEFGGDVEYSKNWFNLLEWDWNLYDSDFWNMSESLEQRHELQNFVKNTGIIAGLLILSAVHPGKYKLGH